MKRMVWLWIALIPLLLAGCGGGGGGFGGGAILQGRVVLVGTGTPPNPPATVIVGGVSTRTDPQNGSFRFGVDPSARTLTVRTPGLPDFTFPLPPLEWGKTTDLGDLYVGPQTVAVQGRIVNALTQQPVGEAEITLLGQRTLSNETDGKFTLNNVAYDPNGLLDYEGLIEKADFLPQPFLVDQPAIDGVIQLGDLLIAPVSDENPPPAPGNVRGVVVAPPSPELTRIDIYSPPNAQFPNESVVVGRSDGAFALWLLPGQYKLVFTLGSRSATRTITVQSLQTPLNLGTIELQ